MQLILLDSMKKQGLRPKSFLVSNILSLSLFFPFMPFEIPGRHEIFPIFLFFLFGFRSTQQYFIPIVASFLFIFSCVLGFDFESKTIKELMQIMVVFSSLFLFSKIPLIFVEKIESNIFKLSILLIIFMVFQRLFPEQLQSVTDMLSQRKMLVVDFRTGGVRGFGPEPAYTASLLISFFMFSWWTHNGLQLNRLLIYGLGVLLAMSISGSLTFLALVITQFFYRLFFVRDLVFYNKFYLLVIFMLIANLMVLVDLSTVSRGFDRMAIFVNLIWTPLSNMDIKGFLLAENGFGSQRLKYLVEPITNICCGGVLTGSYIPSYSLYGKMWAFFAPFHFVLVAYYFGVKKLTAVRLASLMLALFFGPILFFLMFIGLLQPKSSKEGRVI